MARLRRQHRETALAALGFDVGLDHALDHVVAGSAVSAGLAGPGDFANGLSATFDGGLYFSVGDGEANADVHVLWRIMKTVINARRNVHASQYSE